LGVCYSLEAIYQGRVRGVNGHKVDGKDSESTIETPSTKLPLYLMAKVQCACNFATIFPIVQNLRPICITLFRKCKRKKKIKKANERFVDW